jgi:hypothetical protein
MTQLRWCRGRPRHHVTFSNTIAEAIFSLDEHWDGYSWSLFDNSPDDPGGLVGQRHGAQHPWFAPEHLREPRVLVRATAARLPDHGGASDDKQFYARYARSFPHRR